MLRPQGTGRRLRLIGSGSIITGVVLLAIGVYCVTTLNGPSFNVDTFAGATPALRDYVLLVIELVVTAGGAYTLFYGIATLRKSRKQLTFARSMHLVDAEFVADPKLSTLDRCWQCGSKVRARNAICLRCGATQRQSAAFRKGLQTGTLPQTNGFPPPGASGPLPPYGPASSPTTAPFYPSHPSFPSHPSHPSGPLQPSFPPYPSYPSYPSHPSNPSYFQPHPYETDMRGDWQLHGESESPEDDDAEPRTRFPFR